MKLKKLGKKEYELITRRYDFYLRMEGASWILDIFNHPILDNKLAYINSLEFDNFLDAKCQIKVINEEKLYFY